jgi:hypothetical protein
LEEVIKVSKRSMQLSNFGEFLPNGNGQFAERYALDSPQITRR